MSPVGVLSLPFSLAKRPLLSKPPLKRSSISNKFKEPNIEAELIETKVQLAKSMDEIGEREQLQCDLQTENERLRVKNAELKDRLRKLRLSCAQAEDTAASSTCEETVEIENEAEDHVDALEQQVSYLKIAVEQMSSENRKVREETKHFSDEKEELQCKLEIEDKIAPEDLEEAVSEISSQVKRKLREKSDENASLKRNNNSLRDRLDKLSTGKKQLWGEIQAVMKDRDSLMAMLDKAQGFNANAVEEANRQIHEGFKRKVEEKEAQHLQVTQSAKKLAEEQLALKETVAALQERVNQTDIEKSDAEKTFNETRMKRMNEQNRENQLGPMRMGSFALTKGVSNMGLLENVARVRRASISRINLDSLTLSIGIPTGPEKSLGIPSEVECNALR